MTDPQIQPPIIYSDPNSDAILQTLKAGSASVERLEAPPFGSWQTFVFNGTPGDPPQRILTQNPKRKKAIIRCLPGPTAQNTAGYVRLGSQAQVSNVPAGSGFTPTGGQIQNGMAYEYEAQEAVYAVSDGAKELMLVVLDERYQ